MGRVMGIDYGRKRIGLAISDPDGVIGSPLRMQPGSGSVGGDAQVVTALAREEEVAEFVVGLPLQMDGREGEQVRLTRAFAAALERESGRPVHLYDERLTTWTAEKLLREADLSREERRKKQDAVAAGIILQTFLDARRTAERGDDDAPGDEPPGAEAR